MKTKEILLAVGGLFLAMNYKKLFGGTPPKGGSADSSTGGGSSATSSGSSKTSTQGQPVKDGYLSNCGSFKWASGMIANARQSPSIKAEVSRFQTNCNRVNGIRKFPAYGGATKNYRIANDGLFGACTQKAALMAFPKNWLKENQIKDTNQLLGRIVYINTLLKGKSSAAIGNDLIKKNKL